MVRFVKQDRPVAVWVVPQRYSSTGGGGGTGGGWSSWDCGSGFMATAASGGLTVVAKAAGAPTVSKTGCISGLPE